MSDTFSLSPSQIQFFEDNGYLVLPNWWSMETIEKLRTTANSLVEECDLTTHPKTIFTTNEQDRSSDAYFLGSGDKVRYFFEEKAFIPSTTDTTTSSSSSSTSSSSSATDGTSSTSSSSPSSSSPSSSFTVSVPKNKAINKIGHNLHELVPAFRQISLDDPRIPSLLRTFGYVHPLLVQSMYIFKQPLFGGAVNPHVDGAFLYTEPQSVLGMWFALENCDLTNGCLYAVPGSHKRPVQRRFKRTSDYQHTEFEPKEPENFSIEGAQPLLTPAGTCVLLHASLVHFSHENKSERSRHAYTLHIIEGGKNVVYPKDNWLQREDGKEFPAYY